MQKILMSLKADLPLFFQSINQSIKSSFIWEYSGYSFIQAISIAHLHVYYYSEALPTYTVTEFHAEAPQATASEGLAQGSYVAARAGFELTTLRTKVNEFTNEPPRRTNVGRGVLTYMSNSV